MKRKLLIKEINELVKSLKEEVIEAEATAISRRDFEELEEKNDAMSTKYQQVLQEINNLNEEMIERFLIMIQEYNKR